MHFCIGDFPMSAATRIYHHTVKCSCLDAKKYIWLCEETLPFDELIVSWNAARPHGRGKFNISIAVKTEDWSGWLPYAFWGHAAQGSGEAKDGHGNLSINQDIIELPHGQYATGFQVAVEALDGANIAEFYALHACASRPRELPVVHETKGTASIELNVPLSSQMRLPHPRQADMCSPASTMAVLSYLVNSKEDKVSFALKVCDETFDVFGNWVLNMAEASNVLGKAWRCWVQRLNDFDAIYQQLCLGYPTVVSIRGPLPGSALPYAHGHLVVVKGYDAHHQRVLCMDPAFPTDISTDVSYALSDFLTAWGRRRYIAYVFKTGLKVTTDPL